MATVTIGYTGTVQGDYPSPAAWLSFLQTKYGSNSFTEPEEGQLLSSSASGSIQPYGQISVPSSLKPTSTNTLTFNAAPGASFADNPNKLTNALYPNVNNGAMIYNTFNYTGGFGFNLNSVQNVIIKRLQIVCTSTHNAFGLGNIGSGTILDQCLIMTASSMGCPSITKNCLCICSNVVGGGGTYVLYNNIFIASGASKTAIISRYIDVTLINNAFFGWVAVSDSLGPINAASDYNATDLSSFGSKYPSSATHSKTNLVFANQFQNTTNDFRLLPGSDLIDAGTAISGITTDVVGTTRPQGSSYDIGAWEASVSSGLTLSASPTSIGSGSSLSNILVTLKKSVSATEITSGVSFGSLVSSRKIKAVPSNIISDTTIGSLDVSQKIKVDSSELSGGSTVHSPSATHKVKVGTSSISSGFINNVAVGLKLSAKPTSIISSLVIGQPTVSSSSSINVSPNSIIQTSSVESPTVKIKIGVGFSSIIPTTSIASPISTNRVGVSTNSVGSGLSVGNLTVSAKSKIIPASIESSTSFGTLTVGISGHAVVVPSPITSSLVVSSPSVSTIRKATVNFSSFGGSTISDVVVKQKLSTQITPCSNISSFGDLVASTKVKIVSNPNSVIQSVVFGNLVARNKIGINPTPVVTSNSFGLLAITNKIGIKPTSLGGTSSFGQPLSTIKIRSFPSQFVSGSFGDFSVRLIGSPDTIFSGHGSLVPSRNLNGSASTTFYLNKYESDFYVYNLYNDIHYVCIQYNL